MFVKNQLEVRGTLMAHGFSGQPIEVELLADGQSIAKTQVRVPEGTDIVPDYRLEIHSPSSGEKKLTLKVTPIEGEFVTTNNEISTFVTVLSGGLNVMFLQGPNFTWDYRFLMRSIMTSRDIQVEGVVIRRAARGEQSEIDDAEFAPGRYNVYVLSDLPADYLAPHQHKLLADAVKKGGGLMMLGGAAASALEGGPRPIWPTSCQPRSTPAMASSSPKAASSSCPATRGSPATSSRSVRLAPRQPNSGT